jgi:hypothetical protein
VAFKLPSTMMPNNAPKLDFTLSKKVVVCERLQITIRIYMNRSSSLLTCCEWYL